MDPDVDDRHLYPIINTLKTTHHAQRVAIPSTGTGYEDDTIQRGLHQAMSSVDAPRKLPLGIHELNLPLEGRIIENVKMDVPCRMDSPLRSTAYHVCKTDKI